MEGMRYKYVFDEIMNLTDDGFIVIDPDCIVLDINEKYRAVLGKPKEEIVGFHITKCIANSSMPKIISERYSERIVIDAFRKEDIVDGVDAMGVVSRSCIIDEAGEVVAGIAQVKFGADSLSIAKRLLEANAELEYYRKEYDRSRTDFVNFSTPLGNSEIFQEVRMASIKAAQTDFEVLLTWRNRHRKRAFCPCHP